MCIPMAKAKSAATCRPHNGGKAGGGGSLCHLPLRGATEFKKEVKEPFFEDAEGEESGMLSQCWAMYSSDSIIKVNTYILLGRSGMS